MKLWLFAWYESGLHSDKLGKILGFRFFLDHCRMKVFSAKISAKFRKKYPDFCSNYWKLI